MKYSFGKYELNNNKLGEVNCYLLTNGLGGYSSTTILSSLSRNDHSLFVPTTKENSSRIKLVDKLDEKLEINGSIFNLSSQIYKNRVEEGSKYLVNFTFDKLPVFTYFINGITLKKTVVMKHNSNTVGVKYEVDNPLNEKINLIIEPVYSFVTRETCLKKDQLFNVDKNSVTSNGLKMYISTNSNEYLQLDEYIDDFYFSSDVVDGKNSFGSGIKKQRYIYKELNDNPYIVFSTSNDDFLIDTLINDEINRQNIQLKRVGCKNDFSKRLLLASDAYIIRKQNNDDLTVIAGYPFFLDWGRDTMISLEGLCINQYRFDELKEILRNFVKFMKNGIMPNLFPEGKEEPRYNNVDTSLLFFETVYLYYKKSNDIEFVKEVYSALENIIYSYKNGTDNDIFMDKDYLISAGSGTLQLTWMDVNYKGILPTKRHGKPVEINSYWYNALVIFNEFSKLLNIENKYFDLIEKVKRSFSLFYNEKEKCLKDVISGNDYDYQIRPNQIYSVSLSFSPLSNEVSKEVVQKVFKELFTPYGLRSLAIKDKEFSPIYEGSLEKRDMSYHQGTVWVFLLGAFYKSYLKVNDYSKDSIKFVKDNLCYIEDASRVGCVGYLTEIYDGLNPSTPKGCFSQSWSVSELLNISLLIDSLEV